MTDLLPADRMLTPRRQDILVLMANGYTNDMIAQELYLAVETVKTNVRAIYHILGANDRPHCVAIAMMRGIIKPSDIRIGRTDQKRG